MSTSLLSNQALLNPDWIDLYLAEPTGPHISDFPETINHVLRSCPTLPISQRKGNSADPSVLSNSSHLGASAQMRRTELNARARLGLSSDQLNKKFLALLSQFGRFWIKTTDGHVGEIFYRTPSGIDMCVNNLSMSYTHRVLIVRINGMIIPTICLAQLKILLQKYGQTIPQDTLKSIHHHWHPIEDAIQRHRTIFNTSHP